MLTKKIEDNCYCIAGLLALGNDMSEKDMQAIQEYNLDNLKNIVKLKQMSCLTCKYWDKYKYSLSLDRHEGVFLGTCESYSIDTLETHYCKEWESKDESS